MKTTANQTNHDAEIAEYAIIGAGPAGLCAVASLLKRNQLAHKIVWIDPQFAVGDFGGKLSVGSSVPGNTTVQSYQRVLQDIYQFLPKKQGFAIDALDQNVTCALNVAAEPLRNVTSQLRQIVHSLEGMATKITTDKDYFTVTVSLSIGMSREIKAKRVILAIGSQAKTFEIPSEHQQSVTVIDPNIAFIYTSTLEYLRDHSHNNTIAVIGSSHSAALAVMHLLKAGCSVRQFMNKEYKYATPEISPDGIAYTKFDNTGLKGEVAKFTRQLISEMNTGTGEFTGRFALHIGEDRPRLSHLITTHLSGCSHVVAAIGYAPSNTLLVDNHPVSSFTHQDETTEFAEVPGLFGIGIAFPQKVKSLSGEIEFAVGVGKFWTTMNNPDVINAWKKSHA